MTFTMWLGCTECEDTAPPALTAQANPMVDMVMGMMEAGEDIPVVFDPIMLMDTPTDDGREFASSGYAARELPLSFTREHNSDHLVGRLTEITVEGDAVRGKGFLSTSDPEHHMARMTAMDIARGDLKGVSVEVAVEEAEVFLVDDDGNRVEENDIVDDIDDLYHMRFLATKWTIGALTVTTFPAFGDAKVLLDADAMPDMPDPEDMPEDMPEEDMSVVAHAGHDDLAGGPLHPPKAWFDPPNLTEGTPTTVTDEGEVLLHVAPWQACHTGFAAECVPPPRSVTDYAYFHNGTVTTEEGEKVSVGRIVMNRDPNDRGHAPTTRTMTAADARQHYDNACNVVAYVRVGEDDYGIWAHGVLAPDLTLSERRRFEASGVSGDWRPQNEGLELLTVHTVGAQGFPVPKLLVADGEVKALIAGAAIPREVRPRVSMVSRDQLEAVVSIDTAALRPLLDAVELLSGRVDRQEALLRQLAPTAAEKAREAIAASANRF